MLTRTDADRGVEPAGEVIVALAEAILGHRRCRLDYPSLRTGLARSLLYDPYRLRLVQGVLYCLGRIFRPRVAGVTPVIPAVARFAGARDARGLVVLAVHRIRAVEPTGQPASEPDPALDLDRYEAESFGAAWDAPMTVVIRFAPALAPYVRERLWHRSQTLRSLDDGGVELSFRAGGASEIVRWLLAWGDGAELLAPPALREAVARTLRAASERYTVPEPREQP